MTSILFGMLVNNSVCAQKVNKKLIGTWQRVALKGNNPCKIDQRIVLNADGSATLQYGYRFEECEQTEDHFNSWFHGKKSATVNGKKKKLEVLLLEDKFNPVNFIVLKIKKDLMRVSAFVPEGDTTYERTLIFKRI
ncbi:MAG: hypothetical protein AAGG68_11995 [Bacteroidota bacterium]